MKIGLIGNQNSGKTSLFNALTGSNQKVGNWPGVTIDRKEGFIKKYKSTIVDLPGIYSLSPYSSEEEVSRKFALEEDVDLFINIVDATSLERSLYLTTQVLELDVDVVIALNMYDLVKKKGIKIDIKNLEKKLGCTVVPISAKTKEGLDKLEDIIFKHKYLKNKHTKIYPKDIEKFIVDVSEYYKSIINKSKEHKNIRFIAVKILEEDRDFRILMSDKLKKEHIEIENKYKMDGEQLIASLRYDYISYVKKDTVFVESKTESISDKLDRIFLHKYFAIPIFIFVMALVYMISIGLVGGLTSNLIDALFNGGDEVEFSVIFYSWTQPIGIKGLGPLLAEGLGSIGASGAATSLIENGVISGLSSVLSFLPQLVVLFIFLAILETTGYMSRISFFLDRIFHNFGLSGKSLVPFIVGAGCSVPGVMSSRTVEDENERNATIALVPFIPCNAKLTVISLIVSQFFGKQFGFLFALLFYFMAIVIIVLVSLVIKKIFAKNEHSTFISELPEYKSPSLSYVSRDVFDKTISFIKRAGTVVLFFSIIVWFLTSHDWTFRYLQSNEINQSMLYGIGNTFAWFFYPILAKWDPFSSVSIIEGLVAKEQVISSMTVIANSSGASSIFGAGSPFAYFTPLTGFAFCTFNLFSVPCIGTLSTMKSEFKSWKKMFMTLGLEIGLAWVISSLIGVWGFIK